MTYSSYSVFDIAIISGQPAIYILKSIKNGSLKASRCNKSKKWIIAKMDGLKWSYENYKEK